MGKIRTKDVKKRIGGDFKKKTAKVGKKVSRGNVTTISVSSKRIVLPLQASLEANRADISATIDGLIRLMQHHSAHNRASALTDLQHLFENNNSGARKFIGITMPHILELLFDGTAEVHRAMIELLSSLLSKFPDSDFISMISVLVTYLCSGMTSLNEAVRKDTLTALHVIATIKPLLLVEHAGKLFDHVLSLMEISVVDSSTQSTYSLGVDEVANASDRVTSKLGVGAPVRKKQASIDKQKSNKRSQGTGMLLLSFRIISAMLKKNPSIVGEGDESVNSDINYCDVNVTEKLHLRPVQRKCLVFTHSEPMELIALDGGHHNEQFKSNAIVGTSVANSGYITFNSVVLQKLCVIIRKIWNGFLPESPGPTPYKVEVPFREMVNIVNILTKATSQQIQGCRQLLEELRATAMCLASQFPYQVLETSCVDGSKKKVSKKSESLPIEMSGSSKVENQDPLPADDEDFEGISDDDNVTATTKSQSYCTVNENILEDSRRRFMYLNISICESVIHLFSEDFLLGTSCVNEKQCASYSTMYQSMQRFLMHQLQSAVDLLTTDSDEKASEIDLTPKEYYQKLFNCLQLCFLNSSMAHSATLSTPSSAHYLGNAEGVIFGMYRLMKEFLQRGRSFRCKGYTAFIESCVRALCGISDSLVLQVSHDIDLESIADDKGLVLSSLLSSFHCGFRLMTFIASEPGCMTQSLLRSGITLLSLVPHERVNLFNDRVLASLGEFSEAILCLFKSNSDEISDELAFYCRSDAKTRFGLIELWATIPTYSDLISSATIVMGCIWDLSHCGINSSSTSNVASGRTELQHFLRLLHSRRQEISMGSYVAFIFNSIDDVIGIYAHKIEEAEKMATTDNFIIEDFKSRFFLLVDECVVMVTTVVFALLRCSSPDQPHKLAGKIISYVDDLINSIQWDQESEEILCPYSSLIAGNNVALVLNILLQILTFAFQSNEILDDEGNAMLSSYLDISSRAIMEGLCRIGSCTSGVADRNSGAPFVTTSQLVLSEQVGFLKLMSFRVLCADVPYLLGFSVLKNVPAAWPLWREDTKVSMLRIVKEFYILHEFTNIAKIVRTEVESLVFRLQEIEQGGKTLIHESLKELLDTL